MESIMIVALKEKKVRKPALDSPVKQLLEQVHPNPIQIMHLKKKPLSYPPPSHKKNIYLYKNRQNRIKFIIILKRIVSLNVELLR